MGWVQNPGDGSALATLNGTEAPALQPFSAEVKPLMADALAQHEQGHLDRAMQAYQQVMGLDAECAPAMMASALIHSDRGEFDAAQFLLRRALKIAPTCFAYNTLGQLLLGRRQWDEAVTMFRASLALDPSNLTTWPNLFFALDIHPDASPALRLAERRRFNELHCKALTEAAAPHTNDPDPERRLRVGYVSGDWKQHSAANGFGPVVFGHRGVDLHLYDADQGEVGEDDLVAKQFRNLPTAIWHDVRGYDDATLAATIRADQIDILVDLVGYSSGSRVMAFARKPAPIQISGFGYGSGLGIDACDYLVADEMLIPELQAHQYHEQPLYLPSFMGFEKSPPWPDVGPPPKLRNGYVTYGYLGRSIKLSAQALAVWAEILLRDPTARLILKCGHYQDAALRGQVSNALAALGVDADRVEFRLQTHRYGHLETYSDIDVMLDPFPHNGGVTTVESMLMGVPPISLLGNSVCGRAGAALLTTLGLKSAIARTPFEYVSHALSVAADDWTHEDRLGLRRCVTSSILMDSAAYALAVEDAYRGVWRTWCADRVPAMAGD